jgi:hypothetical protein
MIRIEFLSLKGKPKHTTCQGTPTPHMSTIPIDSSFAARAHCWNLLSVARKPIGVNSVDSRVTREMANSSINQASHGHCAGVFIGT